MRLVVLPALLCLFMAPPVMAGTVYKCTDAQGHVTYRGTPCAAGQRQQVLHLAAAPSAPAPPITAAAQPLPPPPVPTPAPPAPRVSRAPPPVLYRCARATDDSTYLSRTDRTRPYWVPSGMLDWQRPLAEVDGSRQGKGVGMSAPELMPDPTAQMIGGGVYVRVHDVCRQLPPRAACTALREQYEANEEAIHQAFESDRAPLRKRRQQLRTQMAGCSG